MKCLTKNAFFPDKESTQESTCCPCYFTQEPVDVHVVVNLLPLVLACVLQSMQVAFSDVSITTFFIMPSLHLFLYPAVLSLCRSMMTTQQVKQGSF